MAPTREQTIDIFKGLMPCVESPPHSNHTKIGVEYGWDGVAWCCECISCVIRRAFGSWINKTAGVADLVARTKRGDNGWKWLNKDQPLQVADITPFDWTLRGNPADMHVEMCLNPATQVKFQDIGGNVNDAISMPWRDRTFLQGIIRPPYADSPGIVVPPPNHSTGVVGDTLRFGQNLSVGQRLVSASGLYRGEMQGDGNFVVYRGSVAVWSTRTDGKGGAGSYASMQGDDNFVVYSSPGHPIFDTKTMHHAGQLHTRAVMQDDGNFVLYTDANVALWASKQGLLR